MSKDILYYTYTTGTVQEPIEHKKLKISLLTDILNSDPFIYGITFIQSSDATIRCHACMGKQTRIKYRCVVRGPSVILDPRLFVSIHSWEGENCAKSLFCLHSFEAFVGLPAAGCVGCSPGSSTGYWLGAYTLCISCLSCSLAPQDS